MTDPARPARPPKAALLEDLEARHAQEERTEAARSLDEAPRPLRVRRPVGGRLLASEAWLERLYHEERIVREKKPGVFDHLRSWGPYFASVDDDPLSVLDGMSQTATVCGGFSEDPVVAAYVAGAFGDTLVSADDPSVRPHPSAQAYADRLRSLVPGLSEVSFVGSGAEANEKALALCRTAWARGRDGEGPWRVLAFEGSFHGRTLLSLHASYNPKKRGPFEIAGHEVSFAPFPTWWRPQDGEPACPPELLAAMGRGEVAEATQRFGDEGDPLLSAELQSLAEVDRVLAGGEHVAVIVEPMQSEGGDRYATARFFRCLRLLTRHHGVALVFDEVQTGFGLGGTFAWHSRFGLVDRAGAPDGPDCVTFAKRAQVGVVMSRFSDPEPTSSHPASAIRGLLHADMMADDEYAQVIEREVRTRLDRLAERFPRLVESPRATGYALAFDLPSPAELASYLAQRFWRGAIIFGAGTRTVRYRLSTTFDAAALDRLFQSMEESLSWLEAHPEAKPPAWLDLEPPLSPATADEVRVRRLRSDERQDALARVLELEERVYEPARRDSADKLGLAFEPDGVAIGAEVRRGDSWQLVGTCLAAPLERVSHVAGPDRDPFLGRHDTLYSLALTVDPAFQGRGIGRRLKACQLAEAREMQATDGGPRYRHVSGRNRVGAADAMIHLNRRFGAYELYRLPAAYGDDAAEAFYYRMPVGPFRVGELPARDAGAELDFASGLARPFAMPPASLRALEDAGGLFGPAVNKVTLCNYVTPAVVRATEWVASLAPAQPHLYLTSSRDETFDKAVRALRVNRPEGQVVIGLEGGYVGHTTGAARSLSDPRVHRQGPGYFRGWPRLPHPARDPRETVRALRDAVQQAGGPEKVLGLFVEPLQERTGRALPDGFGAELDALRDELGLPVVFVETASASYRSGRGPFHGVGGFEPDLRIWWGGGQVGFVHVAPGLFVETPLTLVSTWDGDELSLVRVHHQLRAARHVDVSALSGKLDEALGPATEAGMVVQGRGLFRVVEANDKAPPIAAALAHRGVRVRVHPQGALSIIPPLDVSTSQLETFAEVFAKALAEAER